MREYQPMSPTPTPLHTLPRESRGHYQESTRATILLLL